MVGLSVPLYQFPGTIFDIWEGDFRPFSAACSGVRSCPISCVSVRSCAFSSRSRMCVELLKTAREIINPLLIHLILSSHPIQSPRPSPRLATRVAGRFPLLAVLPFGGRCVVWSSLPLIGLRCLVVSSVSVLSPTVLVCLAPLVVLVPCGYRACLVPPRHAVARGSVRLIAFRSVLPIRRAGGVWSGRCLRRVMVFSCPHGVVSSRFVLVPCRLAWRGWLLEKRLVGSVSFVAMWSSFRLCRCLPPPSPYRLPFLCGSHVCSATG